MYEDCADVYLTCEVNIYLMAGTHYVLRKRPLQYKPLVFDGISQNVKLNIQPYYCTG